MTVIRHTGTSPTDIPDVDYPPDACPCGSVYTARNGTPDRTIYDAWCDAHIDHMEL